MLPLTDPARFSLKHRIVAAVLAAACLVWALLGIAMYRAILKASAVEFDERLEQQAEVIQLYADHEYAETQSVLDVAPDHQGIATHPKVVYQIWNVDGHALYRSAGAPWQPLAAIHAHGFHDVELDSTQWRVFSSRSRSSPLVIEVAEPAAHRHLIATRVSHAVMMPVVLALPLLALLVYWLTHAALKPIERFAGEISKREAGDMSRLSLAQMPAETVALGAALNDLLERHGEALERESRFTGDAAHELKTPLAAVRAQAQVALRARTMSECSAALSRLIGGVDRANRLVTQLLSLSRLEHDASGTPEAAQKLAVVVEAAGHDLAGLAESRRVLLDCGSPADAIVPEETAYLLVRNLLDNAIRHSPPGGAVHLRTTRHEAQLRIVVSDQGPGIPNEFRERVLERFYRNTQSYEGSGLGLSIVARIVGTWGGELKLDETTPGCGLTVRILVPLHQGAVRRIVRAA